MRTLLVASMMCFALPALAEDDRDIASALAHCPGAAEFRRLHPRADPMETNVAAPQLPELRDELLRMRDRDQKVRAFDAWSEENFRKMMQVDAEHLPLLRAIVDEHGFPSRALVGADGASAAWLLVQHADADPEFQARVLEHIRALPEGEVSTHDQMLLTDRVLAGQGQPQRYGSQLIAQDGRWVPKPLEGTKADVDARRAEMDEMPLDDYICVASRLFPAPPPPGERDANDSKR